MTLKQKDHPTHSLGVGYLCWIFGWMGAHRFYYGKPLTGTLYYITLGLLGIGWIVDLFLMPGLQRNASRQFHCGHVDYTVAWILLVFFGLFGAHRFYLGKWKTGLLFLFTGGLFGIGWLVDLWGLNWQISEANRQAKET